MNLPEFKPEEIEIKKKQDEKLIFYPVMCVIFISNRQIDTFSYN